MHNLFPNSDPMLFIKRVWDTGQLFRKNISIRNTSRSKTGRCPKLYVGSVLGYLKFTGQIAVDFLTLVSSFPPSPYFAYITSFFFLSRCHCDVTCLSQHLSLPFSSLGAVINSTFSMELAYLLSHLFYFIRVLLLRKRLKY